MAELKRSSYNMFLEAQGEPQHGGEPWEDLGGDTRMVRNLEIGLRDGLKIR